MAERNIKNMSNMQLLELYGEKSLVHNCQESYLKQKYEIKNAKGVNNFNLLIYYSCLLQPSFILRLDRSITWIYQKDFICFSSLNYTP